MIGILMNINLREPFIVDIAVAGPQSIGSGYAVSGNHKIRCFGSYTAPIVYTAASVRLPSQCREDTPCSVAVRGTIELCGELLR